MNILVERETDLEISWSPCVFLDKYIQGPIGRRGQGPDGSQWGVMEIATPILNIPHSVAVTIKFKVPDSNLFLQIVDCLKSLQTSENLLITYQSPVTIYNKVAKPEYKTCIDEVTQRNQKKNEHFDMLIKELEKLGCWTEDVSGPKLEQVGDECYTFEPEINWDNSYIKVCCHKDTKLFNFLNDSKILEKNFPQWYKDGKF